MDTDQLMNALNRLVAVADTVAWLRLNDSKCGCSENMARELSNASSDVKHIMTYGKLP